MVSAFATCCVPRLLQQVELHAVWLLQPVGRWKTRSGRMVALVGEIMPPEGHKRVAVEALEKFGTMF